MKKYISYTMVMLVVASLLIPMYVTSEEVFGDWCDWPDVDKTHVKDLDFMRVSAIPENCNAIMNFNLSNRDIDNLLFEEWSAYWGEGAILHEPVDYNGGNISILNWSSGSYYEIISTAHTGEGIYSNPKWNWSLDPLAPALEDLVNASGTVRIRWFTYGTEASLIMNIDVDYCNVSTVEALELTGGEWNLVSIPVDVKMTAQELYLLITSTSDCVVSQISNWTGGAWETHLPQISPSKNNFIIDKAVMVYITNTPLDNKVAFYGPDHTIDENMYSEGWNMESWHCSYVDADDALTSIGASKVISYNSTVPGWDSWDGTGINFEILDNEGYFVLI